MTHYAHNNLCSLFLSEMPGYDMTALSKKVKAIKTGQGMVALLFWIEIYMQIVIEQN